MQGIPTEPEPNDANAAAKLTAYTLQNDDPELELDTTHVAGKQSAYGVLNEQTEQETDTANSAAYLTNYEEVDEDIKLELNTTGDAASSATPRELGLGSFIGGIIVERCVKCRRWRCKWIC